MNKHFALATHVILDLTLWQKPLGLMPLPGVDPAGSGNLALRSCFSCLQIFSPASDPNAAHLSRLSSTPKFPTFIISASIDLFNFGLFQYPPASHLALTNTFFKSKFRGHLVKLHCARFRFVSFLTKLLLGSFSYLGKQSFLLTNANISDIIFFSRHIGSGISNDCIITHFKKKYRMNSQEKQKFCCSEHIGKNVPKRIQREEVEWRIEAVAFTIPIKFTSENV